MVAYTILAGGYDVFVAAYLFNSTAGTLGLASQSPTGANPSWISLHPTNRSILYAVNENSPGALQSFTVTSPSTGLLSPAISTVASGGDSPAFATALSTGEVAVMNYGSGNGLIIPTTTESGGLEFDANRASEVTFPPPQTTVSHPHMAYEFEGEVLVPDLGGDKIWTLVPTQPEEPRNWHITSDIPQPTGSGPRHIAIYDNYLYTIHELSSTLTVQRLFSSPNISSPILSTLYTPPPSPPSGSTFAGAEVLVPPSSPLFPQSPFPFIYVSNRNTGTQDPRGDTIAIVQHVNRGAGPENGEALVLVDQVYTGLDQIRGMQFSGKSKTAGSSGGKESEVEGEFLIAGGVAGDAGVVVYRRVDGGRGLEEVARNTDIPTRTSFVWL